VPYVNHKKEDESQVQRMKDSHLLLTAAPDI